MKFALPVILLLALASCGRAPTTAQMRSKIADSVAIVRLPMGGSGSGFIVTGKSGIKYVATNAHVCESVGAPLHIQFSDHGPVYVETALQVSVEEDLCLVSLGDQKLPALKVKETARPGEHIYTAGHPLGKGLTVTQGDVVDAIDNHEVGGYPEAFCADGKGKMERGFFGEVCVISHRAIDFNAAIYPGNSGGPLLNESGDVVGIDFAGGDLGGAALRTEPLKAMLSAN
jgi:S1-C subfamily serine protease